MTLNSVVERIMAAARTHAMIKQCEYGHPYDLIQGDMDLTYPLFCIDINQGQISRKLTTTAFNVDLWFCDLVNVNEAQRENELEVKSDLTGVAEDVAALLNDSDFDDWIISDSYSIAYFKEKLKDITGAVRMSITVNIDYRSDRCRVPLNS